MSQKLLNNFNFKDAHAKDYTIVIGSGSFGANVAALLSEKGESVMLIDKNMDSFSKLSVSYGGLYMQGDGTDIDLLKENNIEKAGTVVCATMNDNVNIMVGLIAKKVFKVPHVIVRIYNNDRINAIDNEDIKIIRTSELLVNAFSELIKRGEA